MGHEDIETTRKYYIHENSESREAARKAFEDFYKKACVGVSVGEPFENVEISTNLL